MKRTRSRQQLTACPISALMDNMDDELHLLQRLCKRLEECQISDGRR
jgi:hypothetical protein